MSRRTSRRRNFVDVQIKEKRPHKSHNPAQFPYDRCIAGRRPRRAAELVSLIVFIFSLIVLTSDHFHNPPFPEFSPYTINPNDCEQSAPYIFDSVFSFLKQWHNTYAPNGHSVVRAFIPPNTLLYHATNSRDPPTNVIFFALDAEMSIGIFGSVGTPRLFTMITTQRLELIYFDGQSASLTNSGSLDSQIALLNASVQAEPGDEYIYDETRRANELCSLVESLGIDGIVRMNAGFEVLLCDYATSGVKILFSSNLTVPDLQLTDQDHDDPHNRYVDLPQDPNRQPPHGIGNIFAEQNGWEWIRSGVWHYGSSSSAGSSRPERRVKLDYCAIASFYSPQLQSLSGKHHKEIRGNGTYHNGWGLRRGHRLLDISVADVKIMRSWISNLTTPGSQKRCSGIDWQALTETITDQHQSRAREIWNLLLGTDPSLSSEKVIRGVHELSHAVIYPYLEYPSTVGSNKAVVKEETILRCASLYTANLAPSSLNEFETPIKDSIDIVMNRICRWEWDIFEWSENWTSNLLDSRVSPLPDSLGDAGPTSAQLSREIRHYQANTAELLEWIGWDLWLSCEEECSWKQFCYIPMWPVIYAPGKRQGAIYAGVEFTEEEMREFWTPKCISREDFDKGGGRARDPWHQLPDIRYNDSTTISSSFRTQESF